MYLLLYWLPTESVTSVNSCVAVAPWLTLMAVNAGEKASTTAVMQGLFTTMSKDTLTSLRVLADPF